VFGWGGRYICRRSPRARHSNRWCVTVSWLLLHIKHVGAILGFILFRISGGRYICRRSPRARHSNRWCVTVSWLLLHIKHVGAILGFILFRCAFRGMCCVLNQKIMTCSCLCNRSKESFKFGVVICAKTALPVVSITQLFSHSSFLLFTLS
jgi:hypothetical protein